MKRMAFEWTSLIGPGTGVAGVIAGGVIAKFKSKTDRNTAVVSDANAFAKLVLERQTRQDNRLDRAEERLDEADQKELQRDDLARRHIRWDWKLLRLLHDAGSDVSALGDPPPLFVYDNEKTLPTAKETGS